MEKKGPEPVKFDKCPNCGVKERIANEILKKQIAVGNMPKTSQAYIYTHQSIIAGQVGTWISAPVIISYFDICTGCGTVYCIYYEVQTAIQGSTNITKSTGFQNN